MMKNKKWVEKVFKHMIKLNNAYWMQYYKLYGDPDADLTDAEHMEKYYALMNFSKNYRQPFERFIRNQGLENAYKVYDLEYGHYTDWQVLYDAMLELNED